jgi:predicted outer membrane repeat protein
MYPEQSFFQDLPMRFGLVSSAAVLLGVLSVGCAMGQQLLLTPTPLNFGKLTPGQTSATMMLYVENNSNSAITIGTVTLGGTNSGDFAIVTNNCGSSLTAFNICILTLDFAPTTYGARTATVTETSSIGTGTATLNGSGVPATFSPTTVSFPATPVGQTSTTETTTLTNNTANALTITSTTVTAGYTITANTCTGTLAASPASCTVTMTFTPTTSGVVAGTLSVVDNIETETASLTGIGMSATSAAVAFPAEAVGATETSTVTFAFAASTTLSQVSVLTQGVTGQDFNAGTQLGTACKAGTYSNGQTCTVVVNFRAGGTGRRQGSVLLYDNESTPQVVGTAYLQGTGTGANAVFYPGTGTSTLTFFNGPTSPVVDAAGNIVVSDSQGIYYMPVGVTYRYVIGPAGHASNIDGAGNVYYGMNNSIYEIPLIGINPALAPATPVLIATLPTAPDNSMMIDAAGNLFVPTYGSGNGGGIYEIAAGTHTVTNVIAQGAATSDGGTLGRTIGTFMDAAGDMYLADFTNSKIDEVLAGSTTVTVVQPYDAYLNNPYAITVDAAGDLFVTNYSGQPCTLKYALVSGAYNRSQYCNTIVGNNGITLDSQENLVLLAGNNLTRYTRTATPTLAFQATAVGGTSATQTTNLENEGNAPLVFTSIAASSTNFVTTGTACTTATPLATGANCNVVAAFTPQTSGSLTGTVNLVDNNLATATATQTVPLTGTANYNLGFTTPPPTSLQTGQSAGTVVAALESSSGSVNTSAPATAITLTITGPSGYTTTMTTGTTASGSVTFSLPTALTTTGPYNYALSDANGDTAASVNETVYPYKLAITGIVTPQSANSTATNSVTVSVVNNDGTASTQTNALTLVVSGPSGYTAQTYGPFTTGANGAYTFTTAALTLPGTYTYTASSTASPDGVAVTGASASQLITAGRATTYAVTPASTTAVAGFADNITVSAYDAYGNLVTNYAGTVALTSTDPAATLPANFTLSSGTATKAVTFNTQTSTGWTVTATDTMNSLLTQTSGLITVTPVPVYTVNSSAGDTSGVCTNQAATGATRDADCTVYAAMAAVTALNNAGAASYSPVVNFAPALNGSTITMTTPITLTGNVNVVGPGATLLTLSGGVTGGSSFVSFITDNSSNAILALSGLTFTNFKGTDGAIANTVGSAGSLTITNAVFTNNTASGGSYGGGVFNGYNMVVTGSTFTDNSAAGTLNGGVAKLGGGTNSFTNSVFTSNSAANGGAIYLTGGTLALSGNTYTSNTATANGGVVSSTGTTTEAGSTYTTNSAASQGGAMYVTTGALTIANSTFNGNQAKTSGGAVYTNGTLTMTTGTTSFTGNFVSGSSGGIIAGGALVATGVATISSVNFLNNYVTNTGGAAYGGAAYMTSASNVVSNSLFSGNYASGASSAYGGAIYGAGKYTGVTMVGNSTQTGTTQYGGGMYTASTTLLYNDTITGNTARIGGGAYRGAGTATAYNTVISGNTATATYKDEFGVTLTATLNYIDSTTTTSCTVDCAPLLSVLGNYGGPTQTMVPLPGSPLLGAGNKSSTTYVPATEVTDGRGFPRVTNNLLDYGAVQTNYSLSFVTEPSNTTINTAMSPNPTVQVYESGVAFNAIPSAGAGTLILAATAGTPAYTGALSNSGLETFSGVKFPQPETGDALRALIQNNAATPVTVANATSATFNITDSAATLGFGTPPPTMGAIGSSPGTITVQILTSPGTVYSAGSDNITLTLTGPIGFTTVIATVAAVNGVATFNTTTAPSLSGATLSAAGTYTYTASDTSSSPYTADTVAATETVVSDSLVSFTVSGIPSPATIGTAYSFTVTAIDGSGTTDAAFTGPVFVTSTDGSATFVSQNYTFSATDAGKHTFTISFGTAGTQSVTVTTNGSSATGSESGIQVLGTIWVLSSSGSISELSSSGALIANTGSASATSTLGGVAIDSTGNVWSVSSGSSGSPNNVLNFTNFNGGNPTAFTSSTLSAPSAVAVDGAGYIWVANSGSSSVTVFNNAGVAQSSVAISATASQAPGSAQGTPTSISIDSSGGVWVTNRAGNSVTHIFGAATPLATPLSTDVKNVTLGVKP